MRYLAALSLIFAFAFAPCVRAQTADPAPVVLNEQLALLLEGLAALDGYDRIAKDGVREFAVKEFYKYGKGLRSLVADDLVEVRKGLSALNEHNNELIRQYSHGGAKVPDEALPEFLQAQQKLMREPADVKLKWIRDEELKLDENQIPSGVLAKLRPVRQP